MEAHPKNFSKSANRALDVLSYFAATKEPARAAAIADALGISRSSADQLLKTIVSGGYLVLSTRDKTYFPSPTLVKFGRWISGCYPEDARLRSIVAEVQAETGAAVHLSMQNDCYMQIIEVASDQGDGQCVRVGDKVPVIGSAVGAAALTTMSEAQVNRLTLRARGQRAVSQPFEGIGAVLTGVRQYRRLGYAACAGTAWGHANGGDLWDLAVVAPQAERNARFILGVSGPADRMREKESYMVSAMRRCLARHVSNPAN